MTNAAHRPIFRFHARGDEEFRESPAGAAGDRTTSDRGERDESRATPENVQPDIDRW
jgi:hypothetical protein